MDAYHRMPDLFPEGEIQDQADRPEIDPVIRQNRHEQSEMIRQNRQEQSEMDLSEQAGTERDGTVCCLYCQKKDFISIPYEPGNAEYLKKN